MRLVQLELACKADGVALPDPLKKKSETELTASFQKKKDQKHTKG